MASQVLNLVIKAQDKASGKIRDVNKSMKKMGGASQGLGAKLGGLKTGLLGVTAALAGIGLATKKVINLAAQQEQAEVRLAAVVKATGSAAGLSAQELFKMASAFQTATGMGDELVMEGQAILLTFKNIRKEAFERTMTVALDMAAVLGTDLKGSAMQLGKALNDPKTGLSMLTRVGITFTEKQKEVILALQATGDMAGAQGVILEELESQMGGAAAAMGDTLAGSMQKASGAVGDLGEQIGFLLSPAVRELSDRVVVLAENLAGQAQQATGVTAALRDLRNAQSEGKITQEQYAATVQLMRRGLIDAEDALSTLSEEVFHTGNTLEDVGRQMGETERATDDLADATRELEDAADDLTWSYSKLFDANEIWLRGVNRAESSEARLWQQRQELNTATNEAKVRTREYTSELDDMRGVIETVPWSEYEEEMNRATASTVIQTIATQQSADAVATGSVVMNRAVGTMTSYGSSVRATASAERNLAASVRDRLAAQGESVAPGQGIVTPGGGLRAPRTPAEHEEVHGEAFSGAGGREGWEHIRDLAKDMKARHAGADQGGKMADWGGAFLRTQVQAGGYGNYDEATIQAGLEAAGFSGIVGGAHGLSGVVPGGFPNDSFLIGATSGEHVQVTPRGQGGGMVINNLYLTGVQTDSQLFDAVTKVARQRGRAFAKVM
jgi:hypothetical protein